MIVTIANTKGGVGKTTLALNIAIIRAAQGRDVLLIDGDEQGTALAFTALRNQQNRYDYTIVALSGTALRSQVGKLAPKYDDVVIDTGGRDTGSFRAALTITHRVLIPTQPRTFDVWALDHVAALIDEAGTINPTLQALTVINCADSQGTDNHDAAEFARQYSNLTLMAPTIGRRKAFSHAVAQGLGVTEYRPTDPKATTEIQTVTTRLFDTENI